MMNLTINAIMKMKNAIDLQQCSAPLCKLPMNRIIHVSITTIMPSVEDPPSRDPEQISSGGVVAKKEINSHSPGKATIVTLHVRGSIGQ